MRLKTIEYKDILYFIDYRLYEIRQTDNPHNVIKFIDLPDLILGEVLNKHMEGEQNE
jgi:hypothetical protein